MWDYLQGRAKAEVRIFSDIAIDDVIPVRYLFRSPAEMPSWERRALDECRGTVLDIGAGAGAHVLALQQAGTPAWGIDASPGAVRMMKERGIHHAYHQDIWGFPAQPFDTLLLMMNGIGLVGDLKGLNHFLELAPQWLAPGGQILLDSSDIRYLYEDRQEEVMIQRKGYYGIIRYQMSYKQVTGDPFDWLYIDFPRLEIHARAFGFRAEKIAEGAHYEYLARLTLTTSPS